MNFPESLKPPNRSALRQFAAGWTIFFLGLGIYCYARLGQLELALGYAGVAVAGLGLYRFAPTFFQRVFTAWMLLAFPVGWLASQLSFGIIFYVVVTPFAFLLRLTGRDRLVSGRPKNAVSYWKVKTGTPELRRYFKTY